jgi:glycosyltransferase involved in cell wall biosynthesis
MTIYFNVTDAIAAPATHGVTRTERRLAAALAGRPDVEFVALRDGRLWQLDGAAAVPHLADRHEVLTPFVERMGVSPPPPRPGLSRRLATAFASANATAETSLPASIPVTPMRAGVDDVLVSVGLDWAHGFDRFAEQHVFASGGRFVGMCYDLIPIDHPEWLFPPDPDGFRHYLQRVVRAADRVVCISECTQRDLMRHFPHVDRARVPVLRLGADAAMSTGYGPRRFAESLFDGEPFAIYCATLDRRKNHRLLYRAMREMVRRGIPGNFVFVGRLGSGTGDLVDAMRHDRAIAGRIAHVTNCDDEHLAALYERSAFAVYPSLYEGWGLGVTEALAHRKMCIVASGSSLAEAGLGRCIELHPLRTTPWVEEIAALMAEPPVLSGVDLPTWENAADDLVRLALS